MISYPLTFQTQVEATAGTQNHWKSASREGEIACAIPPEFDGPGGAMSPEDLYAHALTNCFAATFLVYAEKSRASLEKLVVRGRLTVDRDDSKRPWMKAVHFQINVQGCPQPQRLETLVKKAIESGFILQSVKTSLTYELELDS